MWTMALVLFGCASDRVVATRNTERSGLECGERVAIGSANDVNLGDLVRDGSGALLLWSDDESSLVVRLDPDGTPTESRDLGGRLAQLRPRAVLTDGLLHISAHNHFLAGAWRTYYDRLSTLEEGWNWDEAIPLSLDGPEALDTQITRRDNTIAVAFRQGIAIEFVTLRDGVEQSRITFDEQTPNPRPVSLIATDDAFLLASEISNRVELWRVDTSTTLLGEWTSETAVLVEGPELVLATDNGIEVRGVDGALRTRVEGSAVTTLSATRSASHVWAAISGEDDAQVLAIDASGGVVASDLGPALDARIVWISDRALAVWVDASSPQVVWAQTFCVE